LASKRRSKPGPIARIFNVAKLVALALVVLHVVYVILLRWVDPPLTLTQLGAVLDGDGLERDYVDLAQISREVQLAVIAAEDQLFVEHGGFDVRSIERALEEQAARGGNLRGASTISQQVAKNVFLWQGRSWLRKGLEAYFTALIELVWGKQRILEVYLNVIEMGGGVFGIEAAAQRYFGKPASQLSRREAALIASILPNPKQLSIAPLSPRVRGKSEWIIKQVEILEQNPAIVELLD
jgi:monofunctional biosynthetic peptidoglycan transglycosylase